MPSRARAGVLAALVASLACATPAQARDCVDQDLVPSADNAKLVRGAVRCLINEERRIRGRVPVLADRELRRAADRYSRLMVAQHFMAHVSPGGSTVHSRVRRTHYLDGPGRWELGETIGSGVDPASTPRSLVRAWMASSSHRAHILGRSYRDVGIGVVLGTPNPGDGPGATYNVVFGRRYQR